MPKAPVTFAPPSQLGLGSGRDTARFELSVTHVALHGVEPHAVPEGAALVLRHEGIAVVPKALAVTALQRGARWGPVYVPAGGSSFAVPTGRVFLRVREGESVEALRDAIDGLGFSIDAIPAYAPHAAWLKPKVEDIAAALSALSELQRLPNVVALEPELLMQSSMR